MFLSPVHEPRKITQHCNFKGHSEYAPLTQWHIGKTPTLQKPIDNIYHVVTVLDEISLRVWVDVHYSRSLGPICRTATQCHDIYGVFSSHMTLC